MKPLVGGFQRKADKIMRRIISLYFVKVMNYFCWDKKTSNMFFYYKPMFTNIVLSPAIRMIRAKKGNVTVVHNSAASPVIVFRSFTPRIFLSLSSRFFSYLGYSVTTGRAIFAIAIFDNVRFNLKFFTTNQTIFNHSIFQIKRLCSVCLSETIKFHHLLRALNLCIKKSFPTSEMSIA